MDVHAISGSEVDVCEAHGMWLDRGELGSIVRRFSKKQASLARRAVKDARFSGKVSAWLWGPLAFLFK
jgi:Zn-finger nucleic acid-binding protein